MKVAVLFVLLISAFSCNSRAANLGDQISFQSPDFTCSTDLRLFATTTIHVSAASRLLVNARLTALAPESTGSMAASIGDLSQQNNDVGFTGQINMVNATNTDLSSMTINEFAVALGKTSTVVLKPGNYSLNLLGSVNCAAESAFVGGVLGWVLISAGPDVSN